MTLTVLYPEALYPDDTAERGIFDAGTVVLRRDTATLAELDDADCRAADGLMIFRHFVTEADLARFPRLRCVVRMGVGYDRVDRAAAAARQITVCNVPDYGTTEVADHAIAMALALRRGLLLHDDAQRGGAPWQVIADPLVRRLGVQGFGIVGLGRIGTAVALRAKALGFRVAFHDPHVPNGTELALGIARAPTLDALLAEADVLSLHAPLTASTRGLIGRAQLQRLPRGAVVVNTARGPILDLGALAGLLRSGHIAGAGLDVLPVEPPADPIPELLQAYRDRADWLAGRLIVTPHSAYWSPEAEWDIRVKSAQAMHAALSGNPQNVVRPEDD
jgi:phosphoglycerate dehydrogenase-like enzyme